MIEIRGGPQVPAPIVSTAEWMPTAGVDRDKMPGIHLAYVVGWKEHSGARWRREGIACLSLHNDGPHGYSAPTVAEAMRLHDMDGIDAIPLWQPLPRFPSRNLVAEAEAA